MGDVIPTNYRKQAGNKNTNRTAHNGDRILSMKIETPEHGDTLCFMVQDCRLVLVHNERRYTVPYLTSDEDSFRQDAIIIRWEVSICGAVPSFHNSDPIPLSPETQWVFGEHGWQAAAEAA